MAEKLKDKAVELNEQKDKLVAEKTSDLKDALEKVVDSAKDKIKSFRSKREVQEDMEDKVKESVEEAKSALQKLKEALASKAKDLSVSSGIKSLDAVDAALDHVQKSLIPEARQTLSKLGDLVDNRVRFEKQNLVNLLNFLEQKYFELREKSKSFAGRLFARKQQVINHLRQLIQRVRSRVQGNNRRSTRSVSDAQTSQDAWDDMNRRLVDIQEAEDLLSWQPATPRPE